MTNSLKKGEEKEQLVIKLTKHLVQRSCLVENTWQQSVFFSAAINQSSHFTFQLTAFAFRDYVRFGYVDQGDMHSDQITEEFNINTYAPTMLLFKEDTEKPVDVIQVNQSQPTRHIQYHEITTR